MERTKVDLFCFHCGFGIGKIPVHRHPPQCASQKLMFQCGRYGGTTHKVILWPLSQAINPDPSAAGLPSATGLQSKDAARKTEEQQATLLDLDRQTLGKSVRNPLSFNNVPKEPFAPQKTGDEKSPLTKPCGCDIMILMKQGCACGGT